MNKNKKSKTAEQRAFLSRHHPWVCLQDFNQPEDAEKSFSLRNTRWESNHTREVPASEYTSLLAILQNYWQCSLSAI